MGEAGGLSESHGFSAVRLNKPLLVEQHRVKGKPVLLNRSTKGQTGPWNPDCYLIL